MVAVAGSGLMKTIRTWVDVLGPLFGILAAALTVYALVYLLWIEPFYRGESYRAFGVERRGFSASAGWDSQEGTVGDGSVSFEVKTGSGRITVSQ